MKPIENFENIQSNYSYQEEFKRLRPGAYFCVIKNAYMKTSTTGKEMLCLDLDILDEEFRDYFQKQYDNSIKDIKDRKWGCTYRTLVYDQPKYFHALMTAVSNSNPGYSLIEANWDESTLIGKFVGGVFGLEEYEKADGTISASMKCIRVRSTEKLETVATPAVKLIDKTMLPYEEYEKRKERLKDFGNRRPQIKDFVPKIADEDLPF